MEKLFLMGIGMDGIIAVGIFVAGVLAGLLVVKFLWRRDVISRSDLERVNSELTVARTHLQQEQARVIELRHEQQELRSDLQLSRAKVVQLETELTASERRIEQHRVDLEKMQERFRMEFENLANKIFEEKSLKFKEQSKVSIGELLNPLKDKISEFQKKVDDSFGNQAKEQFALKSEIERIAKVNERMTLEAEHLTKALRGDTQVQGVWGEVMLEKILEETGLRRGEDYILQGSALGLKNVETGGAIKPDVIVNLPENKHIIVDSKVSLKHYEQYVAAADQATREVALKQFLQSTRTHIIGLEKRRYQDVDKLGTPDFVLLFMPIEGAYALALQADKDLHSFAWDKRIVIVCPTTLFATLRTVANVWRLERQNQNAIEIAKQGGALYDKVVGFVDDMKKLGTQIDTTKKTYSEAFGKLSEGKGNILGRVEKLRVLGVKASKSLPVEFLEEDGDAEEVAANIPLIENPSGD